MAKKRSLVSANRIANDKISRNDFTSVREIQPATPYSGWSMQSIQSAIDSHDQGNFAYSELLYHAMTKQPRIGAALDKRAHFIRNFPFCLETEKDAPARINKMAKEWEKNFNATVSDDTLSEMIRRAVMFGFCIGRHTYQIVSDQIVPTVEIWSQSSCEYRHNERKFYVTSSEGEVLPVFGDPWIIFSTGGARPWLNGAIRKLAYVFFLLNNAQYSWAEFNDVEAQAIKLISSPVMTREQIEAGSLVQKASILRGGDALLLAEGYDLKMVTAQGRSGVYKSFNDLIDQCNKDIAIVLLGNNLAQEISGGSFAAASEAFSGLYDLAKSDATMLHPLYDITSRLWIEKNFTPEIYGETSLVQYRPKPIWDVRKPEDQKEIALTAASYSASFQHFLQGAGPDVVASLPIDWEEQARKCGISLKKTETSSKVTQNE